MPLTLLTGPINSGKTTELLKRIKHAIPRRAGVYVVPADATARELGKRLLMGDIRDRALIGDMFLPWGHFIRKLADARRPVLSATGLTLFIYELMASHKFRYFRMRRPSLGLARQFAQAIQSLKRNGIDPGRLGQILETRGSLKENDLLTIFERYEKERAGRRVFDEGDLTALAIEGIRSGRASILGGIDTIVFDEFCRIEPGQITIIRALKKSMGRADIWMSFPKAADADSTCAPYLGRSLAGIEEVADKRISLRGGRRAPPHVEVRSMRSPIQEARAVASIIGSGLLKDSGSGDEVAIAIRHETPFIGHFLDEAWRAGLIERPAATAAPMSAAFIHVLLSPQTVDSWPDEATIDEYAGLMERFIRGRNAVAAWSRELGLLKEERSSIAKSLAALASLEEALDRLRTNSCLAGLSKMRREAFARLVSFELASAGHSQRALDRCLPFRCVPFEAGLSIPAKRVIIPQMTEGTVPALKAERLFFSEADRLAPVPDETIDAIFPSAEDSLAVQSHLFDTFVEKCRGDLMLTRSIIDEAGAETCPSSFLDFMPGAEPYEALLPLSPCLGANRRRREERLLAIEAERADGDVIHPQYHGRITAPAARRIVRERFTKETLSPTGLERYAHCPFIFFVEKVLGLEKKEEETPEIKPRDRGTIVHAVLERFYRDHIDDFRKAAEGKCGEEKLGEILGEIIDGVLGDHAALVLRSAPALAPFQREAIGTMARQVVMMELGQAKSLPGPLMPVACEWKFGATPGEALSIPIDGDKPALIGGCVDRVDADGKKGRFLVVDYKTGGKVDSVKGDILKGLHLQLPLYTEAARRLLLPRALALGGLLLAVQAAEKRHGFVLKEYNDVHYAVGRSRSAMDEDEWDAALSAALASAASHVAAIRDGRFEANPAEGCPRHCDYEDVCRFKGK